jgi:hypothetical protein
LFISIIENNVIIRHKEILPFATIWMKLDDIKKNKPDTKRQTPPNLIHM